MPVLGQINTPSTPGPTLSGGSVVGVAPENNPNDVAVTPTPDGAAYTPPTGDTPKPTTTNKNAMYVFIGVGTLVLLVGLFYILSTPNKA